MIYVNDEHIKIVSKQAADLLRHDKKPTIRDPYLTFLRYFYENSQMIKILKEVNQNLCKN